MIRYYPIGLNHKALRDVFAGFKNKIGEGQTGQHSLGTKLVHYKETGLKKKSKNGSKDRKRGLYFCQPVPLLLGYHQEMKGLKYLRSNSDTVSWSASENAHTTLIHTQKSFELQQHLDTCSYSATAEMHQSKVKVIFTVRMESISP